MSEIKEGDVVLWRNHKHPHALGIANCVVLETGHVDKHGKPAALIRAMGQQVGALVIDLTIDCACGQTAPDASEK